MICTLFTGQTSKEGIFMRYSYEFKKNCVEMYRRGEYPEIPDGIDRKNFHDLIREWVRTEDSLGPGALRRKNHNKEWTPEEKYSLIARFLAGESSRVVALSVGLSPGLLRNWIRKYQIYGYNGLIPKQKGRKPKNPDMKKVGTRKPPKPNESEYEELVRLRAENEYMKAEIEVIKKEIALREEKEAARLKAKKQQSSRNSEKRDTN